MRPRVMGSGVVEEPEPAELRASPERHLVANTGPEPPSNLGTKGGIR